MKLVIPERNNKTFSTIANAGNYRVTFPTFLEFVREISGREIYEVDDDWEGTLGELRHSLIDKIKKYLPFTRK